MSTLGLFHTAISVVSLGSGTYAFWRDGKIDPRNLVGKVYLGTMFVASATALGIFRHGTFTVGHGLTLVTLALLLAGVFAERSRLLGHLRSYVETISLTTSYLLLMVFTTTETLTRLPAGHPIAANPDAPILGAVRVALLVAFIFGLSYQVPRLKTVAVGRQVGA